MRCILGNFSGFPKMRSIFGNKEPQAAKAKGCPFRQPLQSRLAVKKGSRKCIAFLEKFFRAPENRSKARFLGRRSRRRQKQKVALSGNLCNHALRRRGGGDSWARTNDLLHVKQTL